MAAQKPKAQKLSKREQIRAQRTKQQRQSRLILIGAIIVLAVGIVGVMILQNKPASSLNFNRPPALTRTQTNGTYVGDPNAPVKVEEFSDFNCSHCQIFWQSDEPQLLSNYIDQGKVYFRYVPMSFVTDTSVTAAEAAYCAMDQGKFFEYHDYVFANYGVGLTDALLQDFAKDLGLNMKQFDDCYSSKKYADQVTQDEQYATGKGVLGTPTFDVNGTLVSQDDLFAQIDAVLGN